MIWKLITLLTYTYYGALKARNTVQSRFYLFSVAFDTLHHGTLLSLLFEIRVQAFFALSLIRARLSLFEYVAAAVNISNLFLVPWVPQGLVLEKLTHTHRHTWQVEIYICNFYLQSQISGQVTNINIHKCIHMKISHKQATSLICSLL